VTSSEVATEGFVPLDLDKAIAAVRAQLIKAQDPGSGSDVRFAVGQVEMDFGVEMVAEGGGEVAVKVFGLLSLGGHGTASRTSTHRASLRSSATVLLATSFQSG
jgi:hypothetical protein